MLWQDSVDAIVEKAFLENNIQDGQPISAKLLKKAVSSALHNAMTSRDFVDYISEELGRRLENEMRSRGRM